MLPADSRKAERLKSKIIQLTRDLILIESTDAKPEERRRCFQLVRNHLDALPYLRLQTYESLGYESLVALPEGVEVPEVLLCAHLDVVEHLGPEYYRSKIEGGRIYGPGAGDMKGALAILLVLYHNLLSHQPRLPVGLAITSDEERGGENGARFLVEEAGLRAGAVIIPDGGSIDEVTVEEKGIIHIRVAMRGESAHAARPWLGINPLQNLVSGLHRLDERFASLASRAATDSGSETLPNEHWYPTCSVTGIHTSNESINRIPDEASALLDLRFTQPDTRETMLQHVAEALGPTAEIVPIISADPTRLEPDPAFLQAIEDVLGHPASLARVAGGSDARFFRQHDIPVMLSRPLVGNLHGHDEWIDVASMIDYYRICERYITERLTASSPPLRKLP